MKNSDAYNFCKDWLAAWTGNQPQKLIAFYSEDAFYSDPARAGGIEGKVALLAYFTKLLAKYPHWQWKALEVFPYESGFALKWEAKLGPEKQSFYGMDVVEMREKLIIRNEVYFDPKVFMISHI